MLEFKLTRETTEPVDRNLALLLLALANKYGALNADGTARLEFPITRQTMAELLGVSLETVMLMLRRFREREPIETRRSGGSRSSPGRRSRRSPAPPSSTAPFSSRRCKVPFEDLMESAQVPQEAPVDQLRSIKLHEAAHGLAKGISGHTQDRGEGRRGNCQLHLLLAVCSLSPAHERPRQSPLRSGAVEGERSPVEHEVGQRGEDEVAKRGPIQGPCPGVRGGEQERRRCQGPGEPLIARRGLRSPRLQTQQVARSSRGRRTSPNNTDDPLPVAMRARGGWPRLPLRRSDR